MTERPQLVASRAAVPTPSHPNLGTPERVVSLLAGTLLIANGLREGGLKGWPQVMLGACAAWRGYSGTCRVKRALTHTPFEQAFEQDRDWNGSKVISRSITIGKPREEVFAFCSNPGNLGALVPWVDEIEQTSERTYRWVAHGPMDKTLECDIEQDDPKDGRKLHWIAAPDSRFKHDIQMHFSDAPTGRGTQIKAIVACQTSLGSAGYALAAAISKFSDKALLNLLRSIKQQLELGEVTTNRMRAQDTKDFLFVHPATNATQAPTSPASTTPITGGAA